MKKHLMIIFISVAFFLGLTLAGTAGDMPGADAARGQGMAEPVRRTDDKDLLAHPHRIRITQSGNNCVVGYAFEP